MTKPISDLYEDFSPEELKQVKRGAQLLSVEHELITALFTDRDITDKEFAPILEVREAAWEDIERGEEVLLPTLKRYVEVLGGELEIIARFSNVGIKLNPVYVKKHG